MKAKFVYESIKHLKPKTREELLSKLDDMNGYEILTAIEKGIKFKPKDLNPYIDKFSAIQLLKLSSIEYVKLDQPMLNKLIKSIKVLDIPKKGTRLYVNFEFKLANIELYHKKITYDEKGAQRILGSFSKGGKEGYQYIGRELDDILNLFGYAINFDGKIQIKTREEFKLTWDYRKYRPFDPSVREKEYHSEIRFNLKQLPKKKIDVTKIVKSIKE